MNYTIQADTFARPSMGEIDDEETMEFIARLNGYLGIQQDDGNTTPYSTTTSQDLEQQCLEHLILVMEAKLLRRFDDLEAKLNSFSLKQMKRKRTGSNRCKALNRKGEVCNGYVCKNKSKHLCYAHYVLMDKQKEKANYLYSRK